VWTESLSQSVALDVVMKALRDLSETHERPSWMTSQQRKYIINDDALLGQRISFAQSKLSSQSHRGGGAHLRIQDTITVNNRQLEASA
jgi:hypothetical protein